MATAILESNRLKPFESRKMKRSDGRSAQLILIACLLSLASSVDAAKWRYSDGLLLGTAFTDNVRLSENDEESSFSAVITPHFRFSGEGRRISTKMSAAFQFVTNSDNTFYPDIRGALSSELVKKRLFLDAFFDAHQTTIDPLRPAGSIVNTTGNLSTRYSIGINPYWREHFGSFADLRLDYLYERQTFHGGDNSPDDRDFNDFYANLASGRLFKVFTWNVRGAYEDTKYKGDSRSDTTFRNLDIKLGYRLTRHLQPYFTYGREWNTYETTAERRGGNKWLVGTRWTPNSRVNLDLGYGYRFFGHYPYISLNYRHRRSSLYLRYTEDINSGYSPRGGRSVYTTRGVPGARTGVTGTSGSGAAGTGGGTGTSLLRPVEELDGVNYNGAYVDRRFLAGYRLNGKRTTFALNADYSHKFYADTTPDFLKWILGLHLGRRLGKTLSADVGASLEHTKSADGLKADTWKMRLGVTRRLGNFTHLRFSYTFAQRDSNRKDDSYDENRFALVLNTSLSKLAKHVRSE